MDCAARNPPIRCNIVAIYCHRNSGLVGQSVMPFVEPFWGQPLGRAFIFGSGERARARHGACEIRRCNYDQTRTKTFGWSRLKTKLNHREPPEASYCATRSAATGPSATRTTSSDTVTARRALYKLL